MLPDRVSKSGVLGKTFVYISKAYIKSSSGVFQAWAQVWVQVREVGFIPLQPT